LIRTVDQSVDLLGHSTPALLPFQPVGRILTLPPLELKPSMNLPPWEEVVAAVTQVALPAFFTAAALVLVGRWHRATAPWAALLALVMGFMVGNQARGGWNFAIGPEEFSLQNLYNGLLATLGSLEESTPTHSIKPPPARTWLPYLVLLALLVDQLGRGLPVRVGWRVRDLVALSAGFLLGRSPVAILGLTVLILALWEALESLAEQTGLLVPTCLSLTFAVAAVVLLHAHSASLTDCATALSAALGGIAVASLGRGQARGCYAGVAVALPGLLWVGQQTTSSELPAYVFALVAVAPLCLPLGLLPWGGKQRAGLRWGLACGLTGLVLSLALGLTVASESLPEW